MMVICIVQELYADVEEMLGSKAMIRPKSQNSKIDHDGVLSIRNLGSG
jgi:hypothetical protein